MKKRVIRLATLVVAIAVLCTTFTGLFASATTISTGDTVHYCYYSASYGSTSVKTNQEFEISVGISDANFAHFQTDHVQTYGEWGIKQITWAFDYDSTKFQYVGFAGIDGTEATNANVSLGSELKATEGVVSGNTKKVFIIFNDSVSPYSHIKTAGAKVKVKFKAIGAANATDSFRFYGGTALASLGNATLKATAIKYNGTATQSYQTMSIIPDSVAVTGVSIDAGTKPGTVEIGAEGTLTATVAPGDATTKTVSWASDSAAVSVNSTTGEWLANSAGTARITVTTLDGSKTDYCDVTVLPADKTPIVGLELVSGTTLKATIGNFVSTQDYQVWVQQVDASGAGLGWVLEKAYGAEFGAGNTVTFDVADLTPSYIVYVRYRDGNGVVKQISKQIVLAATTTPIITSLDVAGETQYDGVVYATARKTFELSVAAEIANGATMKYEWFNATSNLSATSTYSFTPDASGEYVIFVKVSNVANSSLYATKKIKFVITTPDAPFVYFNANPALNLTVKNNYILLNFDKDTTIQKSSVGNTPKMRLALSEPFKGARGVFNGKTFNTIYVNTTDPTSPHVGGFYVTNPGIYSLVTYISSFDRNENEDYVVKSVTVPRTFGGTVSLTTESTLGGDGTYTIKGIGAGLQNGVNYQYSFWRVDANGHNLVKNWSSEPGADTLTWKPARDGNYTIIVRVRGDKDNNGNTIYSANEGTYEASKSINYSIGTPSKFVGAVLEAPATGTMRSPITLSVNVENVVGGADDAVYSFSVYDANRGGVIIRGFAPSNECTWVPDKPGNYIVSAKINGQGSFGYADATVTANVNVVAP